MDIEADLNEIISNRMTDLNLRTGLNVQIDDSDVSVRLQKFFNLKYKMISQKERVVQYSSELTSKTLDEPFNTALNEIKEKFENGGDLNPYLSRHAYDPEFQDGLLNDWALHHLHLSTTNDEQTPYLYSRSSCLLFVAVGENYVYFLDIRPHNESYRSSPEYPLWVRNEFLEIINKNWSNLLKQYELEGFKPSSLTKKDDQIAFRENNLYTLVHIGNKVYMPFGGGITTSGIGGRQIMARNGLLTDLNSHEQYLKNEIDKIRAEMRKLQFETIDNLNFKLVDDNGSLIYLEQHTGYKYYLGPIKHILNIY